jgi:fatty-acyl-CoA synthase
MPLTGVGKIFKPALRVDAARRLVEDLLADLAPNGATLQVEVDAHKVHGHLIRVSLAGVADGERAALQRLVDERLDPLQMRHEVAWG